MNPNTTLFKKILKNPSGRSNKIRVFIQEKETGWKKRLVLSTREIMNSRTPLNRRTNFYDEMKLNLIKLYPKILLDHTNLSQI